MCWGQNAITHLGTNPLFNTNLVGAGNQLDNRPVSGGLEERFATQLSIRIPAPFMLAQAQGIISVRCIVDTGTEYCLFKPDVADALGIRRPTSSMHLSLSPTRGTPGQLEVFRQNLTVVLGALPLTVPIHFPVRTRGYSGGVRQFEWDPWALRDNILGMSGVVSRRMLCFTPERLFVLDRL